MGCLYVGHSYPIAAYGIPASAHTNYIKNGLNKLSSIRKNLLQQRPAFILGMHAFLSDSHAECPPRIHFLVQNAWSA